MADAPGSPVAAAERHDPFTPSNVGPNTPGKRAPTAAIWTEKQFLRLLPGGRRSAPLIAKGFTHVCVLRRDSDGKPCNTPLKLTKNKLGGTWLSTKALAHVRSDLEHASHPLAIQDRRAKEQEATRQMAQQAAFEPLSAMTKTDASGPLSHFVLTLINEFYNKTPS